jgi:deazaflavin-dependent oxidoreductase (nitroreductase family)
MPELPAPPSLSSPLWRVWNAFTGAHVNVYRLTRGRIGGKFQGARVLLLHHVGRKSGKHRVHPLLYLEDGDDLVIVASKGGVPKHPAWWLNLRDRPDTTVEVGGEKRPVRASLANAEERERIWPRLVEMYPEYGTYQRRTERQIPVVILRRAA